ncbi:MAG: integrase, partial [Winogradskyella sp.]|nr:integrase [Winogradskyella sp.]
MVAHKLTSDQVEDYLYQIKTQKHSPSASTFKHTVYGLRFMLKQYDLPYSHLKLPPLKRQNALPVVLSKQDMFGMLQCAPILKH